MSRAMQDIFQNFGIYVHVPFCASNCGYCRFYKHAPTHAAFGLYLDALGAELNLLSPQFPKKPDTMFWGGGTPSLLPAHTLESMCAMFKNAELLPTKEWTVEVSPATVNAEKLDVLKDAGVTRISMGVQSLSQKTLDALGRRMRIAQTMRAIELISAKKFPHFSIDLIFGANGQTPEEWAADLDAAVKMPVDHISAYCLEFESGTSACAGFSTTPEKETHDASLFEYAMRFLPEHGFAQYEISNYAKTASARCLHNLSTWHMAQWAGLGPSGASQLNGFRRRNTPNLERWAQSVKSGRPEYEDIVELDANEMFSSALIFGLRMNDGVSLPALKERFTDADYDGYLAKIRPLVEDGVLMLSENGRLSLAPQSRVIADAVAVELL